MKRFHVHVSVEKLDDSIRFYSSLFGAAPTVVQPDYAKWMLDEPYVNIAISQRGRQPGINHLGFQVDSDAALKEMRNHLVEANASLVEQTGVTCCYTSSDKYWVTDPQGIAWETFHSLESVPMYGDDTRITNAQEACCLPLRETESPKDISACCVPLPEGTAPASGQACCA